jgi:predicted DNA binding protein
MVIATVRVRIPSAVWVGRFSTKHPTLRIELLSRTDQSPKVSLADFWIAGGQGGEWTDELARFREVYAVDCLYRLGLGYVYRLRMKSSPIVGVYRRLGLTYQFPLHIRAGLIDWEIAARLSVFNRVLAFLRSEDPATHIVSIRRHRRRGNLPELTEAQLGLLNTALSEGYFAVPRGITLTELARKLGRSKSTISRSLALIEKTVLESATRSSLRLPDRGALRGESRSRRRQPPSRRGEDPGDERELRHGHRRIQA